MGNIGKKVIYIIPFCMALGGKTYTKWKIKEYVETLENCTFMTVSADEARYS